MIFTIDFLLGVFCGAIGHYFFNYKKNINFGLNIIKDDIKSLHVKFDKFISLKQ